MKINRRNFIALLAGGVAGAHITPLPWKLTDDIAIWTQNWPWVPVPPVGKFSSEKTVCGLCPGGCGIEVRKVDSRAVKIEGRTDYPINPGGICPLGMGGLQLLYNESIRFPGPMIRVGPRGEGTFQNISWDEALKILADRINKLRKQEKPETVAVIDGSIRGSSAAVLAKRLMDTIGSPNYLRTPCLDDTYRIANKLMLGHDCPMAYDLENSSFILSFGAGLLEGWGAPGRVLNSWGVWHQDTFNKKTKIIQIEPRASNTASKSDQWIAPKPGTESTLALGVAHVLIKKGLYNRDFVESHVSGFEGFKSIVIKGYAPDKVSETTGVKAEVIVKLAEEFSGAKAPVAIYGKGKGTLNGSLLEVMAVQSLNALVGNINKPGGVLVFNDLPLSPLSDPQLDYIAQKGLSKKPLDQVGNENSSIDTLLIFASNPAYTLPDGGSFRKALKKIPFIVSFSPFRDETAVMADLILPDHTFLEKTNDIIWPVGLQYPFYALSRPVVEPVYDTRNIGDTIIQLAKNIGGDIEASFVWDSFEEVVKERAQGLFDFGSGSVKYDGKVPVWIQQKEGRGSGQSISSFDTMWDNLKGGGFWFSSRHAYYGWESLFKTPTGKLELVSTNFESSQDKENPEDTLTLLPYEIINLSSGPVPNPPFLYKTLFDTQLLKNDSFADINPQTAEKYGVKQGDLIFIESAAGRVKVRANLFEGTMPNVVCLPFGFGHTAYDEFSKGKGVNPNDIIHGEKDPLSGHPVWWNTPVKLFKA